MQELLTNPAIQAAGAPFVVALILALVLRWLMPVGIGLSVTVGFLVAVWLITGLTLQPLTSTRKIIICSLSLPFVALLLEMIPIVPQLNVPRLKQVSRALPAVLLAAATLWIIWPVVQRQEGSAAWIIAMPAVLFTAVAMYATGLLAHLRGAVTQTLSTQAASALVLAMGTGAVTLIAASALYSQLAFAVSAAMGAVIVVVLFMPARLGTLTLYTVAVPVTLIAAAATVYAKLPVLVLLCLAFVPLFAWLPVIKPQLTPQQRWLQLVATCVWASIPVLAAIWLAWRAAGPVSF